ncbi:MAG: hypothetical protein FRX49_03600 [Trebouxia sp. A1-2]|nr:MAG: hypothetical protein FRX49_03600 [Trebouxia sp. A1-2]
MGLRHGCPLSATLYGLFIDGLHHYLETVVPAAGFQIQHMRLRELVYADYTCLMASSPEHLQALIDTLSSYCAVLHMEISVPKTKVLIVSPVPAVACSCNNNPVEQGTTFKYLGLHIDQSGAVAHLISPIKSKAGGSWAAVQRRHSLLQRGKTATVATTMENIEFDIDPTFIRKRLAQLLHFLQRSKDCGLLTASRQQAVLHA